MSFLLQQRFSRCLCGQLHRSAGLLFSEACHCGHGDTPLVSEARTYSYKALEEDASQSGTLPGLAPHHHGQPSSPALHGASAGSDCSTRKASAVNQPSRSKRDQQGNQLPSPATGPTRSSLSSGAARTQRSASSSTRVSDPLYGGLLQLNPWDFDPFTNSQAPLVRASARSPVSSGLQQQQPQPQQQQEPQHVRKQLPRNLKRQKSRSKRAQGESQQQQQHEKQQAHAQQKRQQQQQEVQKQRPRDLSSEHLKALKGLRLQLQAMQQATAAAAAASAHQMELTTTAAAAGALAMQGALPNAAATKYAAAAGGEGGGEGAEGVIVAHILSKHTSLPSSATHDGLLEHEPLAPLRHLSSLHLDSTGLLFTSEPCLLSPLPYQYQQLQYHQLHTYARTPGSGPYSRSIGFSQHPSHVQRDYLGGSSRQLVTSSRARGLLGGGQRQQQQQQIHSSNPSGSPPETQVSLRGCSL